MSTHADPAAPPAVGARPRPRRPSPWRRLLRLGCWGLVFTLIGLNSWWVWDDRPLVEIRTINDWIARGRWDDAERALRHHLRRSRSNGEARMVLARLLAIRKDYLGCARQLHEVPAWWPAKGEALFLEAESYKRVDRARDAEAARKACLAADLLHPVPPRFFHAAARDLTAHYILEVRLDEARQTLWRAYDMAGPIDRPAILVMLLRAEFERIAHEEAAATLRRYVHATPDDWEARRALAIEEQWAGHEHAAESNIQACLKARPADPGVWRSWLEILHRKGDLEGVKAALNRLPPSADGDAEVWKYRGLAREWAGDPAGASEAYRRATLLKPYDSSSFYRLGLTEQRLGRTEQARDHIRHSQELNRAYLELHTAYLKYVETSQRAKPGDANYDALVERIASLCDQLGWTREADAWRRVLSDEG
jgi:tetratricopeptide (TPR) repeat protein